VLLDADRPVEPFRPPGLDELSAAERAGLRSRLTGAVDGWRWATELGLRLTSLDQAAEGPSPGDAAIAYVAHDAPLALAVEPEPAVAVVCLSLGGSPPTGPSPALSAVDLAVLDLWARGALGGIARALDVPAGGEARRLRSGERPAPPDAGPLLAASLSWAGDRPAGWLLIPARLGRREPDAGGPTLGEAPAALLEAPVALAAHIDGPALPLSELLTLEPGDLVLLGRKSSVEVTLGVADTTLAAGRPGAQGDRMAVRITRTWQTPQPTSEITEPGGETPDGG